MMVHLVTTADGLAACVDQLNPTDTMVLVGAAVTSYISRDPTTHGDVVCFESEATRLEIDSIKTISYAEWIALLFEKPVQTWS
jgi:hypothetical protein